MAEEIVIGHAIDYAFELLFGKIKSTIETASIYKDKFIKISATLEALIPEFQKIKASNRELNRPPPETDTFELLIKEGRQLISEYPDIKKWKYFYKIPGYTTRLHEWDESLDRLLKILIVQSVRDLKEIRVLLNAAKPVAQGNNSRGDFTVGLDVPLEDLKMELLHGNGRVLVLTAPPGCGKTTLAHKLCHDHEIREKFNNNIMFAKVSRTPNLISIVQQLYEKHHNQMPYLHDEDDATTCLRSLLMERGQSPMLLVLDDVWSGSEYLVQRFILPILGYKILVTSRSNLTGFGSPYILKTLSDEDAVTLFRHYAILEDGSSNVPDDDIVNKVVQHCKKVPLALELVGTLLRGKSQEVWERKVEEWSEEESSVLNFEDKLLACLKSSLDYLGEKDIKLKECFMDLASFHEEKWIPATALIDMWTELHELRESHAIANVFELHYWNMANVVVTRRDAYEKDGYYSEHFVTQHDMLRELAIHQSQQEMPKEQRKRLILESSRRNNWRNETNELTFNARLVSVTADESFSNCCNLNLPEAEVLILNFQARNYALPDFLKNMNKLKVLIITNNGFLPARFELLNSLNNLKRIRFERIVIPSLAETSITLQNLQTISFSKCKVAQAFGFIQISEVFPSLEEITIEYCTDLVELSTEFFDMVNEKLKKISITHCHKLSKLPEEIENLVNLELLRLRSCAFLENLPESMCSLSNLNLLDISDCFSLRNLPEDIGNLRRLVKLNMTGCSRLKKLPPSVLDFLQLKDVVCDEELGELWESCLPFNSSVRLRLANEVN